MINRVDRRSQLECLKQCGELLKQVRTLAQIMGGEWTGPSFLVPPACPSKCLPASTQFAGRLGAVLPGGHPLQGRTHARLQEGRVLGGSQGQGALLTLVQLSQPRSWLCVTQHSGRGAAGKATSRRTLASPCSHRFSAQLDCRRMPALAPCLCRYACCLPPRLAAGAGGAHHPGWHGRPHAQRQGVPAVPRQGQGEADCGILSCRAATCMRASSSVPSIGWVGGRMLLCWVAAAAHQQPQCASSPATALSTPCSCTFAGGDSPGGLSQGCRHHDLRGVRSHRQLAAA